ncbi:non-ribosomal peptide synthetase [Limnoraphis robusta]|uniref:Amino acid adenylation domain-containing protein n=1 Tax=Limnoraphis robusta CCNP1315 TaxID=3110306 RepID=A0ABU5TTB1_9CYAN|nr:non-ribosomal peptide synthetase [Limnoraphis robusta]MEA5517932.1 amino acid adenylation domain-containing protein [Limnoraphis robusta CCNP1315]MEA5543727.1 amino acid adenylation domain-containing protein [Limnoraphis robusta CCNP1324]
MSKQDIVDIYELSPMQQGMLFHTLYNPRSGVYFEQRSCLISGELNTQAFKQVWQQVITRHPVLRTAFYWEELEKPLQVVYSQVNLPFIEEDWQNLTPNEQENKLQSFLTSEREKGFQLDQAPLMRCALFKVKESTYQFVWSHHHLLMDGWCNGLIIKEVLAFYEAFKQGQSLSLKPSRPYREYISWLQQQDISKAEKFWHENLKDFTSPTQLTIEYSKKNEDVYGKEYIQFSSIETVNIQSFCQQHHLTLNTVIQGAWALLLSRYSGEYDVVFGATVSGRPPTLPGVESIVGLFINTLPVRVKVSPQMQLISWLQTLQTQQIEREQYAYSSLIDIQKCSEVPTGTSLFESLLVFENYPISLDTVLNQSNSSLNITQAWGFEKTNYPLALFILPNSELLLRIDYNKSRFIPEKVKQILINFKTLLLEFISNPQARLFELSLLSPTEQHKLLIEWNKTETEISHQAAIHQLFEAQVKQRPDAVAVADEHQQLTYQTLNYKANQLAHYLHKQGVKSEQLIGICLERSCEMLIALLAVMKVGAAYVPLDPAYPKERLFFIIEDAKISLLLTEYKLLNHNGKTDKVIYLDEQWEAIAQQSYENIDFQISPQNLAYVIYTSGSTGQPKGVEICHNSLTNFLIAMRQKPGLLPEDIVFSVTTLSFDIAALELYLPIILGARLIIISREIATDGVALREKLSIFNPTLMQATPATWRMLIAAGWTGSKNLKILCGGEALDHHLTQQLLQNSEQVWNLYGPTETTIWSAIYQLDLSCISPDKYTYVSIGRPLANTQFYVLDSHLQPVPIGVQGELYISGLGVARGYFNRPKLTSEKFIPNPLSRNKTQERLYKTGDLVRYLPDGNLEYLGRSDEQVKIRGFRIELGEIEAALNEYPKIKKAVAIVNSDEAGEQRLVVYFIRENITQQAPEKGDIHNQALRLFLEEKLPKYMIPSAFVELEAFPLTPNGKIDRRALAAIEYQLPTTNNRIKPQTPVEEILVGIWENILNLQGIGIHENFFELGGHSLLATRVVSLIRQIFKIEFPLRYLFDFPTIAKLAKQVDILTQNHLKLPISTIQAISRSTDLPLSFAQQRQWFLSQFEPNNPFYNIPVAIRLQGTLNITILKQTFSEVIHRHEVLRTAFHTIDGKPKLSISETCELELPIIDLSQLSPTKKQATIEQFLFAETQQHFDLGSRPLFRLKLLPLKEQEHILLLTFHHIIYDGWSMGVLLHELSTLYQAFLNQEPSPLEELPIQYVDFASWQREWLKGEVLENQLSYWRQKLHDAPTVSQLPTDRIRPAIQTVQGGSYTFNISQQLLEGLKILSQQSGSTLFITLLTAFYTLIHRYTGNEDIIIGSPIANRNRAEIEKLIGFFVNTLALRVDLSGNPTFEELLQRVRQVSLEAYANQDLPFEQLLEELKISRSLSYTPLFQIMFVLQNDLLKEVKFSDLSWSPIEIPHQTAKFDLTLSLTETDEHILGIFEYNKDLFESNTICILAEHFNNLLEAIIVNPEQKISELTLLNQDEEQQILVEWNQTKTNYPREACIHQLFEQQVEQYPDAIALTYADQQLTYRELNIKANQIAHYLRKIGTKTDTLIGICMERSLETFVSILGILKAGSAYVFLEKNYPQERLEFILKDTQVSAIITDLNSNYFEALNIPILNLETDLQILSQESSNNPIHQVTAENLAYVMYTSGSTGKPKGVCIPHRGVVRLVKENNYVNFNTEEIFLQAAPLPFDASTFEIWGALLNGGRIVILPTHQPSLNELGEIIKQYNITTLWLTAGLFHLMVDEQLESFKNVRQLLAGGDILSVVHVNKLLKKIPNCKLVNGYGPTESTTFSCCYSITNIAQISQSVPIGYPIYNTQIYVLDRYFHPVPTGVPGELYIGGDGLARGYLNRADLTAEKFIPNPFNPQITSHRLYKTGDLVRYKQDGTLEYLGRLDNQVKVRGFRIEIGEIEAVLTQHSSVQDVAVITDNQPVKKRLIAYVVLDKNSEAIQNQSLNILSQLRSFLTEKLPDYMIPALFVPIESLPLTANGKVDYRALSQRELIQLEPQLEFVNPETEIEMKLAEIWSEILQIERVGIHDNFFEIGGDSILAIQIISKASKVGIQLTPKQIFQAQTIAELAAIATVDQTINSEQGLIIGSVPLTPIQHWFFENHKQDIYHFNQATLLEVKQSIDIAILEKTIQQLLIHHDALRLQFEQTELGWKQTITYPNSEVPLTYFDLSNLPEPQQNQALEFTVNEVHKSLNLLTGSLVRVALLNLGCERGYRLLFVIHHLAVDGLSWRILLEDFQTIYEQLKNNQKLYLSLKTTSLKQWSDALQEYANSDLIQQERNYWLTILTQETDSLPIDYCWVKNTVQASETVTISLSLEKTKALLKDIPSAYNTHINDILLTALTQTISSWTGQNSLLVDLENHGRESMLNDLNLSRTVGWFTSIFPMLLELNTIDLGGSIKTIKEQLRQVPNSGMGYGILRYLAPSESKLPNSKAEICFNYLGQFDQMLSSSMMGVASESSGQARSFKQTRAYLLEINGLIIQGQLKFYWTYSKNFHNRTTIEKLAMDFKEALNQLINHCCSPEAGGYTPSDFSLAELDQNQLNQVLNQIEF